MIITEFYKVREDGVDLYRTYSDQGVMIHCNEDGHDYQEAVNIQNRGYTFYETDIPIEPDRELTDTEALDIIMGRELPDEFMDGEIIPEEFGEGSDLIDGSGSDIGSDDVSSVEAQHTS